MSTRVTRCRAALVEVGVTAALTLVLLTTRGRVLAGGRTLTGGGLAEAPFDRVLVQACAAALLVCAAWGWLTTTAVVLEAIRGAKSGRVTRGVPPSMRRLVLGACGVALAGGTLQPALAASGHHHRPGVLVLNGLPYPDRALGGLPHASPAARPPDSQQTVVVRPGDTLWGLAAADLARNADDTRIAERCHALYTANRAVIGPDPDLIAPGQTLHLPGKDRT